MFQRFDGTVLTEDCPVGVARQWRRVKTLVVGGLAATALAFVNLLALGRDQPGSATQSRLADQIDEATWQVREWLGLNPRMGRVMLGKVALVPRLPTPPANSPRPAVPASQSAAVPAKEEL